MSEKEDFSWVSKVDSRLDWVPGKPWNSRVISFREAERGDLDRIAHLLHKKLSVVFKWQQFNGFSVRLAVRNYRNPVGIVVAEHKDEENLILASWFSNRLFSAPWPTAFARKLVQLVSLEQPEVPTRWTLDATDAKLERLVRSVGFRMTGMTEGETPTNTWSLDGWEAEAAVPVEPVQPEVTQ